MSEIELTTGPFHPDLESALRGRLPELSGEGRRGELRRVDIVAPSRHLRAYLVRAITLDWGLSLAGVQVLVPQSLAARMLESESLPAPRLAGDLPRQELVRSLVLNGDYPEPWRRLVATSGGPEALLGTIRDLEEARLPESGADGAAPTVLRLYREYQARRRALNFRTTTDPIESAARIAGDSSYLGSLHRLIYYGFYDMTGLQLGFLAACAGTVPVELFLPLEPDHPDYLFAERFREHLRGVFGRRRFKLNERRAASAAAPESVTDSRDQSAPSRSETGRVSFFSASGPEGESDWAAKLALRLIEEEDLRPSDIAVIARNLKPYLPYLPPALKRHAVPFTTSATLPGGAAPVAKAVHKFVAAAAFDLRRTDVVDLLSFMAARGPDDYRAADYGDFLSRLMGVVRGRSEWEKIGRMIDRADWTVEAPSGRVEIDPAGAAAVWAQLRRLFSAVKCLPPAGSPGEMARGFADGLAILFHRLQLSDEEEALRRRIVESTAEFGGLDVLHPSVDRPTFSAWVDHCLNGLEVEAGPTNTPGISLLDCMTARGRRFGAVILLGLNEGAWPRRGPQDPLLPDADRRRLAAEYGLKLQTDELTDLEERLLFRLVIDSAENSLHVGRQRSDKDGRPVNRSPYLERPWSTRRCGRLSLGEEPETAFPRRISDRFKSRLFRDDRLTPLEWAVRLSLVSSDRRAIDLIRGFDLDQSARSRVAGETIGLIGKELTAHDGIVGPIPSHWDRLLDRGVTATTIESYARCPYRYFVTRVLRLAEVERPEDVLEPPATALGELVHGVLARLFRGFAEGRAAPDSGDYAVWIAARIAEVTDAHERDNPIGLPVVWRQIRLILAELVSSYFRSETARLTAAGVEPSGFETGFTAVLPDSTTLPPALRGLKISGRVDRLDTARGGGGEKSIAIDYKYRTRGAPDTVDKNPVKGILRAQRMQPLLYPLLIRYGLPSNETKPVSFQFHYLAPNWKDREPRRVEVEPDGFSAPLWREIGHTIQLVLDGIRRGEFFIMPGDDVCRYCDFPGLCRRNHRPTRYRIKADDRPRQLGWLAAKDERKLEE